ncbi:MAG: response regulator, partial [Lentisphaerae bacterium]|nr:response regulator [Lentisphaerota bacterium]
MSTPDGAQTDAEQDDKGDAVMGRPLRVLYVDDDPLDRALVCDALVREHDGFNVTEAGSRAAFDKELALREYDIILSDFNILGFEGLQVVDTIKAMDPTLPVVIVTGTGSEEVAVEAMKRGAADYVLKTNSHIRRLPHTLRAVMERKRMVVRQRAAEQELQKAAIEWQSTFDAVTDVIWVLGKDGRIRRGNRATRKQFKCDPESIVGRRCWEVVHNTREPIPRCPMQRMMHTLKRESTELTRGDRILEITVDPILTPSGELDGAVHITSDITARKQAEQQRLVLERQIRESQKLESMGVLAGGIAHDFNNLLTGILGNGELALDDLPPSSPVHENINEIVGAAKRAAELCRQMLAYSGRGRFVIEDIRMDALVTEMRDLLKSSISKKADLSLALSGNLPTIRGDATQIRQVLMNLVINASEALGDCEGSIRISTGITERNVEPPTIHTNAAPLPDGLYVTLEVVDTGCGMTTEVEERIFDPFYTTKFTGRGLG